MKTRASVTHPNAGGYTVPVIKPANRGLLHRKLGIAQGKRIPASDLTVHPGDSLKLKREKQFAINSRHWNH